MCLDTLATLDSKLHDEVVSVAIHPASWHILRDSYIHTVEDVSLHFVHDLIEYLSSVYVILL